MTTTSQRMFLPFEQLFTDLGAIGAGWKIYTYETLTDTPKVTYTTPALNVANSNPVVASASGRVPSMFVSSTNLYKAVLTDENDVVISTRDPVDSLTFSLADFDPQPTSFWGTTAGTSSAFTLASNPKITAYSSNDTFLIIFHTANAAGATLAIDGLTARTLQKETGQGTLVNLLAGDVQNGVYIIKDNGTTFTVLNPRTQMLYLGAPPTITIASGIATVNNASSNYLFDTEGGAAIDDLTNINGLVAGQQITFGSVSSARDIVVKNGSGNIINPAGTDITIGTVNDKISGISDGTNVILLSSNVSGSAPIQLIETKTASASASIEFTNLSSVFSRYEIHFNYVLPGTTGKGLYVQVSVNNGSSYVATDYQVNVTDASTAVAVGSANQGTTQYNITGNYDNDVNWGIKSTAAKGACGTLRIYDPSNASHNKIMDCEMRWFNEASEFSYGTSACSCNNSTTAINAIKFFFDSGTIASGVFKLYGVV